MAIPDPMPDGALRTLWCLIKGDPRPFQVVVPVTANVYNLKERIKEEGTDLQFAKDLELWKVSSFCRPTQSRG
jgi:hypothetical protein